MLYYNNAEVVENDLDGSILFGYGSELECYWDEIVARFTLRGNFSGNLYKHTLLITFKISRTAMRDRIADYSVKKFWIGVPWEDIHVFDGYFPVLWDGEVEDAKIKDLCETLIEMIEG